MPRPFSFSKIRKYPAVTVRDSCATKVFPSLARPANRAFATMKAVVFKGDEVQLCRDRALPKLRDDYVLVRPHSVALNPTDWKHVAYKGERWCTSWL
jgi:hypothetical protein